MTDEPLFCNSLRFAGPLDAEGHRCGLPEDSEAHDPLGGIDAHPFDRTPSDEC